MLRAHDVAQRLEQTLQNVRSAPAGQRGNPGNQRQGLVHHFRASLAGSCERAAENAGDGYAEKRRRHIRPVVDILVQSAAIAGRSPPRANEPNRINVQQQRRRAALWRCFRVKDVRFSKRQLE